MNYKNQREKISSLHSKLRYKYGNAKHCSNKECLGKTKIYEWCKKTDSEYTDNPEDYIWLCRSCHRKYDKVVPPPFKGKHQSEETKDRIRKFALTRKWNEKGFI